MAIDIGSFLKQSQITHANGEAVSFSIEFVKEDGKIRTIHKARRFVKARSSSVPVRSPRSFYNLKKNHSILVYDDDKKQHRTIKIARILKFNGQDVNH